MRPRSALLLLLMLCGAPACDRSAKGGPVPSASARVSVLGASRVISPAELSSASAFDLVASAGGLRVVWATNQPGPDWLFEAELAQDGALRAPPKGLKVPAHTLGKVSDLSASFLGEQLGLAWIEQGQHEARAVASVLDGAATPALLDLGVAALSAESARGNIVLAAEETRGRALVMWRGLDAPCIEPQAAPCTGFAFRRLRGGVAEPTGLPLSVPVPCASHSVELAVSPGRFHYGVCTRDGAEPVTTMFSIQYEPEYARAEPLLKGCLPLGTIDISGQPWLVGDCHGKRKAVPVPLSDEAVQPNYIDALKISCTPERALLQQGRFALTLREPRANLQAVLPPELLPTGARAGWTGKSLVVAYVAMSRLTTRSYACRAGTLQPL